MAIVSRVGLEDVRRTARRPGQPEFDGLVRAAPSRPTCGGVRVWSVYVPNGRRPGDPHYGYKLAWLALAARHPVAEPRGGTPFAVLGDFNVAPTDADVWDPAVSPAHPRHRARARRARRALRARRPRDVVPRPASTRTKFTYWDYRPAFPKNNGMRIDLVCACPRFAEAVTTPTSTARRASGAKGNAPSDHAPVVVDLALIEVLAIGGGSP